MEEWKHHIRTNYRSYRRDCRRCMKGFYRWPYVDSSAYVFSIDLVGPYLIGRDNSRIRKGKYIMVDIVLLPFLERWSEAEEKQGDTNGDESKLADFYVEDGLVLPAEDQFKGQYGLPPYGEELSMEEEVEENLKLDLADKKAAAETLNQAWMDHVAELKGPVGF